MLINPYSADKKFKNFPDLDSKLTEHYDFLFDTVSEGFYQYMTPRYKNEHGFKIGYRDIFYYIDMLYDSKPNVVIDVGCGECVWKNWFPNIIGFEPCPGPYSNHDFVDFFDHEFSQGHTEQYDAGMALNSIHFVPWRQIEQQILDAMNIIKPGGRFLFTFNFNVMENPEEFGLVTLDDKSDFLYNILKKTNYKIVMFDCPHLRGIVDQQIDSFSLYVNGHARVVLEK